MNKLEIVKFLIEEIEIEKELLKLCRADIEQAFKEADTQFKLGVKSAYYMNYLKYKGKTPKSEPHHFFVSWFAAVIAWLKQPFWGDRRSAFFAKQCRHSSFNLVVIKGAFPISRRSSRTPYRSHVSPCVSFGASDVTNTAHLLWRC